MAKKEKQDTSCNLAVLDDGMVVIQFDRSVRQMTFTPEQAKQIGIGFIEMGTRGESLQRVSPPAKTGTGSRKIQ